MKKFFIFLFVVLTCSVSLHSQDFRCSFSVSSNLTEGNTDRMRFQEMQKQIQEFINGYKWCNYNIGPEERIECTMQCIITEMISADQYKARLNIGLRRPVYNSTYKTTIFNYVDEAVEFTYTEGEPLIFTEGSFDNNLTALIAYYMNLFLGIYFDSFAPNGGTIYYEKAQSVVNTAQSAIEPGWKSYESGQRNRFWIIENLLNSSYKGLRQFLYLYHLKGLDSMAENISMGTTFVTQAMEQLRAANRQKPSLYMVVLFLDAKRDELINIYSNANEVEKNKFLNVVTEIDPANISKYNQIKNK